MTSPVVFVCGLGRCGTSLTMQMLNAGGVPCLGDPPIFEIDEANHRRLSPAFMARNAGRAMKRLDPHLTPAPADSHSVAIWLDRTPREQARSQVKFLAFMTGWQIAPATSKGEWLLQRDRGAALRVLAGRPLLMLTFEALLQRPASTAQTIARWLAGFGFAGLDAAAMAACVRSRPVACAPDMGIELELTQQHDAAAKVDA